MGCNREQGTHYQCDCMRKRMAKLEEALRRAEEQRDKFFYWAEELAAHGFNCTYGHEGPSKFIPVAREYWSEMQDDIAALSSEPQGSTVQKVTKEQALDIVSPSEASEKEEE